MRLAVCRTVKPNGEVINHPYGVNAEELKRPLTDLGFNLRVKNVTRQINKLYKTK
jgi:hypothetical protein